MSLLRYFALWLLMTGLAHAADHTLLVQLDAQGQFVVWHTEGASRLGEDEVLALAASARPEGGELVSTATGPARAFATRDGIVVELVAASADRRLLIDRDDCGGVKLWHGEGTTQLSDDDLTELMLTALPGGGKRLSIGGNFARGYIARLGVVVLLWQQGRRR